MKVLKKGLCFAGAAVLAFSLTACSASQVTEVFDDLVEDTAAQEAVETPLPKTAITDLRKIDTSIQAPKFAKNLKGSVTIPVGETWELEVTAESPDGGVIEYQWYRNNVNSNGGGAPILGENSSKYVAKASEPGSVFYYAVAINAHGEMCNMGTSSTFEIDAVKNGKWESDEFGKKYVNEDGTFPMETWIRIQGDTYHFDSAGYVSIGWFGVNDTFYYFDEDGKLLRNGKTPDGYDTDDDGRLIGAGAPELSPTTAEIAKAAQEAAAAEAEAAAIAAEEAAAAETQAAEEAAAAEAQAAEEAAAAEAQAAEEAAAAEAQAAEEAAADEEEAYYEEYSDEGEYYDDGGEYYDESYDESGE